LANSVKFGGKEEFMTPLNELLDQKLPVVSKFLTAMATVPSPYKDATTSAPTAMVEESLNKLSSTFESLIGKVEDQIKTTAITVVCSPSPPHNLPAPF